MRPTAPRLPLAPLYEALSAEYGLSRVRRGDTRDKEWLSDRKVAELCGVNIRTVVGWRAAGGIPRTSAYDAADRAGLLPMLVWPDLLSRRCEAADCRALFFPNNGKHRYCTDRCRKRVVARRLRENPVHLEAHRRRNREYQAQYREALNADQRRRYWAKKVAEHG